MKTGVYELKDNTKLIEALNDWQIKEVVIVNISIFYDRIDEKHKAVICYYE